MLVCARLPFYERYSKEFLAKHPELKGKDLETTQSLRKNLNIRLFQL